MPEYQTVNLCICEYTVFSYVFPKLGVLGFQLLDAFKQSCTF